jgi:hypothetical protein
MSPLPPTYPFLHFNHHSSFKSVTIPLRDNGYERLAKHGENLASQWECSAWRMNSFCAMMVSQFDLIFNHIRKSQTSL